MTHRAPLSCLSQSGANPVPRNHGWVSGDRSSGDAAGQECLQMRSGFSSSISRSDSGAAGIIRYFAGTPHGKLFLSVSV